MSDHLKDLNVVLFGVGKMGIEYAKVLQGLGVEFTVVGRSKAGVERFFQQTGVKAIVGGFSAWAKEGKCGIKNAIIAVNVEELADTAISLMQAGVKNVLLEKPGGVDSKEILRVKEIAHETNSKVVIAYNRRFYASLLKAQEMIKADGGVESFHFEFTEWPHTMIESNEQVLKNWFLANSSHVADMAFFLGGWPNEIACFTAGGCAWHPSATIFSGAGVSETGALFSYQANWGAPGRWSIEIITQDRRLIFRPMEKLQVQLNKSVAVDFVDIDDALDIAYKPGLYRQTERFLSKDASNFVSIDEHYGHVVNTYEAISPPVKC